MLIYANQHHLWGGAECLSMEFYKCFPSREGWQKCTTFLCVSDALSKMMGQEQAHSWSTGVFLSPSCMSHPGANFTPPSPLPPDAAGQAKRVGPMGNTFSFCRSVPGEAQVERRYMSVTKVRAQG